MSVYMLGILFLSLNESKNSQLFLGWHRPSDPGTPPPPPPQINLEQTTLVCLQLALLGLF